MTRKKEGRRGNGEGSCQKLRTLANGESVYEWAIRVTLPSGESKRLKGRVQCRSIEEARKSMWAAKADAEAGRHISEKELLMADLLEEWMRERRTSGVSPRTLELQADLIRLHIRPRMGKWKVAALTPGLIDGYHRQLLAGTKLERTRHQIHVVLRQALGYAVRKGYVHSNPTRETQVPRRAERRSQTKVKTWTPEDAGKLLQAALAERTMHGYAIALGLRTGMRIGEVYGLRWQHVDLDQGVLRVEEVLSTNGPGSRRITHPKTNKSRRRIPLAPAVVELLREVKALQAERGHEGADYVFTTRQGEMQHPGNGNRVLKRLAQRLGIPTYSFHALRHGFISLAARQGVSLEEVAVYVGHSDSGLTRRVYLHFWPEHQKPIDVAL